MFKMFEYICWIIAAGIINTSIGENILSTQVLIIISLAILGIQAIKWTIDEED